MPKKYTPAIFQPTVRPSWAGALSYISNEEKAQILEAITKYPNETTIQSQFWTETIKPDLDEQYRKFIDTCQQRGKGAKTYWGELKLSLSYTQVKHKDNLLKDKDKNNNKVKDKDIKEEGIRGKPLKEKEAIDVYFRKDKKPTKVNKEHYDLFIDFWEHYTPVRVDNEFVPKGNMKSCFEKFEKLLNEGVEYDTIITGLKQYLTNCIQNRRKSCGAEVFLNQRRFENDYSDSQCVDSKRQPNQRKPLGIVAIGNELVKMSKYDESDSIPF